MNSQPYTETVNSCTSKYSTALSTNHMTTVINSNT